MGSSYFTHERDRNCNNLVSSVPIKIIRFQYFELKRFLNGIITLKLRRLLIKLSDRVNFIIFKLKDKISTKPL